MKKFIVRFFGLLFLWALVGLVACAPTSKELNAHATEVAARIYATLTAEAPTNTPTLTSTPTITPTFTPTPTLTPTVTPTITPTSTMSPTPKVCSSLSALVEFNNHLEVELKISLTGPENSEIVIGPYATEKYCLVAGEYSYTATAEGYYPATGTKNLDNEGCSCWDWGTLVLPGNCYCSDSIDDYKPLP